MPKKRQIMYLQPRDRVGKPTMWHWKPSKLLRKAGFTNAELGEDYGEAAKKAIELNELVAKWKSGNVTAAPARVLPRIVRFAEAVQTYKRHDAFTGLATSSRAEYSSRLSTLSYWAMDGKLEMRAIDEQMVQDLRDTLVANSSPYRTAGLLRVLRLFLAWAKDERIITGNPAEKCNIPEPPSRRTRMEETVRDAIKEAAVELAIDMLPLAIDLGFWLVQRQGDLRLLNSFAWTEVEVAEMDVLPRHIAALADSRGRVMAYRLAQQKTGTWVDAPVPPFLHDAIHDRMRQNNSSYLFPHPDNPALPIPAKTFQRRFIEAKEAAWAVAIMRDDMKLAEAIDACQFRDLRRTGMIFYKTVGAKLPDITALSGHYVLGRRTILDTYMPGDTAGAIACVATGVLGWRAREARRKAG